MIAKFATRIVLVYAAFGFLVSISMAVTPNLFLTITEFFRSPPGQYSSATLDLTMGAVFFASAPDAKYPMGFKFISVILVLAGILYLILPIESWAAYIDFWLADDLLLFRTLGAILGVVFCSFIIYAAIPRKRELNGNSI